MSRQLTFDDELARAARDRGVERAAVRAGDGWMHGAINDLANFMRRNGPATAESWRYDFLSRGNAPPASHKSWGAVVLACARAGFITQTGRYERAKSVKTHSHPVPVWRAT